MSRETNDNQVTLNEADQSQTLFNSATGVAFQTAQQLPLHASVNR